MHFSIREEVAWQLTAYTQIVLAVTFFSYNSCIDNYRQYECIV